MNIMNVAEMIIAYCNEKGIEITNLKLQKLLFFYQKNHYLKNRNLAFNETFSAYKYGPVNERVWIKYKNINLQNETRELTVDEQKNIEANLGYFLYSEVWFLVDESHKSQVWKNNVVFHRGLMHNNELIKEWENEI
ncbi:DUF4065 domain-containing protein [Mollicutes bacterium LVI A0039]|nr:DUF4065 domain-containing protein [Mollicutes bacterium LVI A0039]